MKKIIYITHAQNNNNNNNNKVYMQIITKNRWQYVFACVLFSSEVDVIYTTFDSNSHGNNKHVSMVI